MKPGLYKVILILGVTVMVVVAACLSPEGFSKATWTKGELVQWYARFSPSNERVRRFGYRGSDSGYHYFITRPIDSFFMPRVSRSELQMEDERPLSNASSSPLYFYLVDPLHDFKKVSEQ